jgi:hypothetical protein
MREDKKPAHIAEEKRHRARASPKMAQAPPTRVPNATDGEFPRRESMPRPEVRRVHRLWLMNG